MVTHLFYGGCAITCAVERTGYLQQISVYLADNFDFVKNMLPQKLILC